MEPCQPNILLFARAGRPGRNKERPSPCVAPDRAYTEQMTKTPTSLDKKFCEAFGRVIIVPAKGENMTPDLHVATMQAIPVLKDLPGFSIEIEEGGKNFSIRNAGKGIYRVSEVV